MKPNPKMRAPDTRPRWTVMHPDGDELGLLPVTFVSAKMAYRSARLWNKQTPGHRVVAPPASPKMRVVARYKTALCRRVADSRRFIIAGAGLTLGKGASPRSAWRDAASLLPPQERASLAELTSRVVAAARQSAYLITQSHCGESNIPDENALVEAVEALDRHNGTTVTRNCERALEGGPAGVCGKPATHTMSDRSYCTDCAAILSRYWDGVKPITRDLLERLIEVCEDWLVENDWRKNTTPKNIRVLAETEQTISKAKGLL